MGIVELYVIIISTLGLVFSLLVYFGMHPRRIQSLVASFVRFMRLHPPTIIATFLTLILINLLLIGFQVGYFSNILTGIIGGITGLLVAILFNYLMRLTLRRRVNSTNTQLLAVMSSRFHSVADIVDGAKIATSTFGPSIEWLQTALAVDGISFVPVVVAAPELFLALERGVVDAVLVTKHPFSHLQKSISSAQVRFLPWSKQAVKEVTKVFPTATRLAVLPSNTYERQPEDIQGYAPY